MTTTLESLAEDYVRVWDVAAPAGLLERVFADDVVDHDPMAGQAAGRTGVADTVRLYHAVFPDLTVTCDDVVAAGDRLAVRWTATGTHEGDQLGMPATHRQVKMTGIDILHLQDGRVVERWGQSNGLELMQQLGVAP